MKKVSFLCKECSTELTDFLEELSEETLAFGTGETAVPLAHYVKLSQSWTYRDFISGRHAHHQYLSPDGDLIVFNSQDYLLNILDVHHHIAQKSSYGCCGWQPRNELNALCPNGHEIGTVHSDECWSSLVFRLSKEHVELVAINI